MHGSMAELIVNYSKDIVRGTLEVLERSALKNLVRPGMRVSLKPNLVVPKPPSSGATTHPEILEGLIIYLQELGIRDLEIIESAGTMDNTKAAFRACGYDQLSQKYGVPLYDLKDDKKIKREVAGYRFEVCARALETDFLINLPVLKVHSQTRLTCCLKNLKGCLSDAEKRRFHTLGLHRPIACLNKIIKTGFCLIDGICGDLSIELGGNPVTRNMLIAGQDPLLLDSYCAGLIGFKTGEIDYLGFAAELGVGRLYDDSTVLEELNGANKPGLVRADPAAARVARWIDEDQACSACYSALVYALKRLGGAPRGVSKIGIGQGFRGKTGSLGCGECTRGFDRFVPGCPPTAAAIVDFLRRP